MAELLTEYEKSVIPHGARIFSVYTHVAYTWQSEDI